MPDRNLQVVAMNRVWLVHTTRQDGIPPGVDRDDVRRPLAFHIGSFLGRAVITGWDTGGEPGPRGPGTPTQTTLPGDCVPDPWWNRDEGGSCDGWFPGPTRCNRDGGSRHGSHCD